MKKGLHLITLIVILFNSTPLFAQEVPIIGYQVDENGQVQLEVASSEDHYYILKVRYTPDGEFAQATSITMGEAGSTFITESLAAYPVEHYQVLQYAKSDPADTDGDGVDDMTEFLDPPTQGPLNASEPVNFVDGVTCIHDRVTFKELSYKGEDVLIDTHLSDLEFVKFYILGANTDNPSCYFMNTQTHRGHRMFARAVGIPVSGGPGGGGPGGGGGGGGNTIGQMRGEIIYHPTVISNNGTPGVYRFEFEPNDRYSFEAVQMGHELLAANMPFLKNNFSYYPMPNAALPLYHQEKSEYESSRIPILFEEDIFAEIDYLALHLGEGYGFLRVMDINETPGSRDVVLYEALPNELSRVGGIITSVPQTPLSHVNLRAIQDNVPNAFIRDAAQRDDISALIGKYVYYRVDQADYFIREATLAEVNEWYDDLRPEGEQIPELDLSQTLIRPLSEINFDMSDAFGAKCANVATMRTFGFPEGTIPNGFGVPFYFYQEFMKYNGFFDDVTEMVSNPDFISDLDTRIEMLKDFRKVIKDADMPQWMLDQLEEMQLSFPEGTSIRCRSSTNNEDLPGFSGAGLYDSKTQHPDEGHISKSIKQVYASMWNFRAFDERDFYRVDHFIGSMGVLCHPNFSNEKANGVGVSVDPIYQTENTFYLNTQIGEDLVTNPEALSIPEEILLDKVSSTSDDYVVIRFSNLAENNQLVMDEQYLDEIRDYLNVIHNEFKILYQAQNANDFAMEIEYKITSDDRLSIKQARPWAGFWSDNGTTTSVEDITRTSNAINIRSYPNPFNTITEIAVDLKMDGVTMLSIYSIDGRLISTKKLGHLNRGSHTFVLDTNDLDMSSGVFIAHLTQINNNKVFVVNTKLVKR